jgi:hypothetical protein
MIIMIIIISLFLVMPAHLPPHLVRATHPPVCSCIFSSPGRSPHPSIGCSAQAVRTTAEETDVCSRRWAGGKEEGHEEEAGRARFALAHYLVLSSLCLCLSCLPLSLHTCSQSLSRSLVTRSALSIRASLNADLKLSLEKQRYVSERSQKARERAKGRRGESHSNVGRWTKPLPFPGLLTTPVSPFFLFACVCAVSCRFPR